MSKETKYIWNEFKPTVAPNGKTPSEEFFDKWWNVTANSAISKLTTVLEDTIKEAFKEHFGFPVEDVKDVEFLERIHVEGCPISWYRYHEETFLYWVDAPDIKVENGQVKVTTQFFKV